MPPKERRPKERAAPKPTTGLDAVYVKRALTSTRDDLDPWRQGCLVAGMRLFWAAPGGDDAITGIETDSDDEGWNVVTWDGERAMADGDETDTSQWPDAKDSQWGVVVSQTCDVMAIGPGSKHPTVQVAPLRRLDGAHDAGEIARIKRHQVIDYHYVTTPPAEGDWAVDMRMSMPVSKSVLLTQTPVSVFTSAREEHDFSERYASKSRRPSLHDEVSTTFVDKLRGIVKQAKAAREEWPERIEQFRFVVLEGDPLQPKKAQLLVVLIEDMPDAADRHAIREVMRQEETRLAAHNITIVGAQFQLLSQCAADLYRRSEPLYVPELGNSAFW